MIVVGNGLAPFRLFLADDYCRERPCAVPFSHVEEGDKPLPYENNQAKVDILEPFRLFVADDYCRERPRAVPVVCGEGLSLRTALRHSAWLWRIIIVGNGLAPFRLVVFEEGVKPLPYERNKAKADILAPFRFLVADDCCRERPCAVPLGHVAEGDKPLPYENDKAKVDILAPFRLFVVKGCL